MTMLVCRISFLPEVHIPLCAISHGCEVEEHVTAAVCVSSLIVNHFHVLLKSQLFINFSSHLSMLHIFPARPPWFYLSDNNANNKIMRSFTTEFSDLFVASVCTSGSKNVFIGTMQVELGLECGLEGQGMLVRLQQG
jgi:hypothetical protein